MFDICEFYPSITEEILKKALTYAKKHTNITKQEIDIILQTKSGLLFNGKQAWNKKGNKAFDVTMGSWDGAEVCDLIGLYLLSQLSDMNLEIGLYRDDALAVTDARPRQIEMMKKKLCRIFKDNGFSITIDANIKSVNFLDVNLNLENETYKPYMKPNDFPLYVDTQSNHPPNILRNIPKSVNRRLCSISSNEEVFNSAIPPYQQALKNSGYDHELKFYPTQPSEKRNNRRRRITWFNPPFSKNVKTNVGENFLKLIEKCFPKNHPLNKIINKNTIKISYKCMPNFKKSISRHNQGIKNEEQREIDQQGGNPVGNPGCNCNVGPCPLVTQNCQTDQVVYRATVTEEDQTLNTYTGLTRNTFKQRYNGHRYTFNHRNTPNSTTLSTHLWKLKDERNNYDIKWNIVDRAPDFNPTTRKCRLCLKEKYYIIFQPEGATLNNRSELFSTCRHRLRLLLNNT